MKKYTSILEINLDVFVCLMEYSTQVFRCINHFSRLIFLSLLFAADEGIIIKTETLDFLLRTHSLEHWAWICSETPWNQFSIEETPPIYKVITIVWKKKERKMKMELFLLVVSLASTLAVWQDGTQIKSSLGTGKIAKQNCNFFTHKSYNLFCSSSQLLPKLRWSSFKSYKKWTLFIHSQKTSQVCNKK